MHRYAYMLRPEVDVGFLSRLLPTLNIEAGLLLSPELFILANMASQLPPGIPCASASSELTLQAGYMSAGDLNSGPHACMAGTLPAEPSPHSFHCLLIVDPFWEALSECFWLSASC